MNIDDQAAETLYGDNWSSSAQQKLLLWKEEADTYSRWHDTAHRYFTRKKYIVGVPTILFGAFTTILLGINSITEKPSCLISILALSTSCLSTICSGIQMFFSWSDRASKHNQASHAYNNLSRTIDYETNIPPNKRPDIEVAFVRVTSAFDTIGTNAPNVPFTYRK